VALFREPLAALYRQLPALLAGRAGVEYRGLRQQLDEAGVPAELADFVAAANVLYPCIGIIDAALELDASPSLVAEVYIELMQQLDLDIFVRQIAELKVDNHWQALAREAFRDDMEWQLRRLAAGAIRNLAAGESAAEAVQRWSLQQQNLVQRWRGMMMELQGTDSREFAVFAVAIRELLDLAQSSHLDGEAG
jgi:glutamate dehydrogenase